MTMIIMSFIIQWVVVNVSATGGTIEDFKPKQESLQPLLLPF